MAGIYSQMFNLGGLTGITSISQLPFIAVGGFGLFLYLLYAGRVNAQIGEKKESAIGMFIVFAFIIDIAYFHDVWLVTILGTIAGIYGLLAFAGVFGAAKKMGKLGYATAKKVKEKRAETKERKQVEQGRAITALEKEVQDEREESLLLLNSEFLSTVGKIQANKSYFFNIGQNIPALTHILTYLKRIKDVLVDKEKESLRVSKLEKIEEKAETSEEKAKKRERSAEAQEVSAEAAQTKELLSEARLLPVQMRSQVQTAVSEIQQVEARENAEEGEDVQEIADEETERKLANMQITIAKNLNTLQKRMIKSCELMIKNLVKIDSAIAKGGAKAGVVMSYPPEKFVVDFNTLRQEHGQIKAVMLKVIEEEIADVRTKIHDGMIEQMENQGEVNINQLEERSEQLKAQIDKVLGGKANSKKLAKDQVALRESYVDLGLIRTDEGLDRAFLQSLQAHLNYLNQMKAALAAAR
ncbi:MAG: hypothetical protein NTY99_02815 [DPANN group archaeon]|nr:hypothetical protein [DPANN group archaeon]